MEYNNDIWTGGGVILLGVDSHSGMLDTVERFRQGFWTDLTVLEIWEQV